MMKLKSKRFCRSISKLGNIGNKVVAPSPIEKECSEIKWELRPGGMLVQKRESNKSDEEMITIRVSTMSKWHDISIEATSTFGKSNHTPPFSFAMNFVLVIINFEPLHLLVHYYRTKNIDLKCVF